mgnify:CR=1 FL=1
MCCGNRLDVCVYERRENRHKIDKKQKLYIHKKKITTNLQRRSEGAYMVTFSLHSLTKTTSQERGEILATSITMCHRM